MEIPIPYCTLCGNIQTTNRTVDQVYVCHLCAPFVGVSADLTNGSPTDGPLRMPYDAWLLVRGEWGRCCGGLSSDIAFGRTLEDRVRKFNNGTHLSLHPNAHGRSSHLSELPKYTESMVVECGINFSPNSATCYWVFDSDSAGMTDGIPLDGEVSYAQDPVSFLRKLAFILDGAAEQAYNSDYTQCSHCGDHYFMPNSDHDCEETE